MVRGSQTLESSVPVIDNAPLWIKPIIVQPPGKKTLGKGLHDAALHLHSTLLNGKQYIPLKVIQVEMFSMRI